jgi:hypothetical protein
LPLSLSKNLNCLNFSIRTITAGESANFASLRLDFPLYIYRIINQKNRTDRLLRTLSLTVVSVVPQLLLRAAYTSLCYEPAAFVGWQSHQCLITDVKNPVLFATAPFNLLK